MAIDIDGDKGRVLLYLSNAKQPVRLRRAAEDLAMSKRRVAEALVALSPALALYQEDKLWFVGHR